MRYKINVTLWDFAQSFQKWTKNLIELSVFSSLLSSKCEMNGERKAISPIKNFIYFF